METRKLKRHPYSQCHVEMDNNKITFISYNTPVIIAERYIVDKRWEVRCTGTYSQTTRRQISWFLREYFPLLTYRDMRDSAESGTFQYADLELI